MKIPPSSDLDLALIDLAEVKRTLRENKPVEAFIKAIDASTRIEKFLRENRGENQ